MVIHGDSSEFSMEKSPENSHRQVMGKQSKDKDSEVFGTVLNGFNMLQGFDVVKKLLPQEAPVF